MTKKPRTNRQMTDKELAALGKVVVASAKFESKLDWVLPLMMKVSDDVYPSVIAGRTIGPKVALYSAVLNAKLTAIRNIKRKRSWMAHVKNVLKAMNDAVQKRNVVVHGLWSPGGEGDSLWVLFHPEFSEAPIAAASKKGHLKVSAGELAALATTFDELSESVAGAYWEFFVPRARKKKATRGK